MARAYLGRYDNQPDKIQEAFRALWTEPPPFVALDAETVSLKNRRVLGVGIASPVGDAFYFDWDEPEFPYHLLMPSPIKKIWHNATFDLSWEVLGRWGADIDNIEDTAIITRLMNIPTRLEEAAFYTQHNTQSAPSLLAKYKVKNMDELPWEALANKCLQDVQVTLDLYTKYRSQVSDEYYEVERKICSMLLHMSHRGIKLDKELVNLIDHELENNTRFYVSTCKDLGFNPHAPAEVGYVLGAQGVVLPFNRKRTQPIVDKNVLEQVDHPWAALTLLARKYNSLYKRVHKWKGKDRAYGHFHMEAATPRITSEKENLHNLPTGQRPGDIVPSAGPVRRVFLPDADKFTVYDLSQIELRVLQYLSGDKYMGRILSLPKNQGGDIHIATQIELGLPSKVMAKNFNFGSIYGGGVEEVSKFTGIRDYDFLRTKQEQMRHLWPEAFRWIDRQRMQGLMDMEVETLYGRKLTLYTEGGRGASDRHIMNCAVNYPIQGSAAEIFKRGLIEVNKEVPIEDFILNVHDEQLLNGAYTIPKELEWLAGFWTPFEVKYVERWQ